MAGFCKHCGKELKDDEPYCPECGMPTDAPYTPQPAYTPKKNGSGAAIAIIAVIVVLSIAAIALIPMFIDSGTTEKYTVTVKVESVSVTVDDPTVYGPIVLANLSMTYSIGSSTLDHKFNLNALCPINGTEKTNLTDNTVKFTVTGDPMDVNYTAFLLIRSPTGELDDYADIYDVTDKVTSVPTEPHYYGCSGVTFTADSYDGSVMTLKGDSDPLGCVKISFTAVKNQ